MRIKYAQIMNKRNLNHITRTTVSHISTFRITIIQIDYYFHKILIIIFHTNILIYLYSIYILANKKYKIKLIIRNQEEIGNKAFKSRKFLA